MYRVLPGNCRRGKTGATSLAAAGNKTGRSEAKGLIIIFPPGVAVPEFRGVRGCFILKRGY
jgi:hypothetical protein